MSCIITIELGTNAVRIAAFDLAGQPIGSMKGAYPTFHDKPDHSEQDPEQIFITMLYILKNLINNCLSPKKYKVSCICFSASMHSLITVDDSGVPLGNAITWADNRGKKEAKALKGSALGKTIYKATGTPIHPMSPMVKIAWVKNNDIERFNQTHMFLSIKSYIVQQLTGEYVIDYSIASATGMLNIHKLEWDADALAYAGITADKLPRLLPVFYSGAKLRKAYQKSLGLSADTKIIIGSSDGCLATLGTGVWQEGRATITVEDSGAVRIAGKNIVEDENERIFNYVLTKDYFITGGPTNNGGVIFEWFTRQFGNFNEAYDMEASMANLIEEAAKVPTGSEGLIFLPYLLGERAPIWNPSARGSYFGINIRHQRQHFVRATIEGMLYELYSIGEILEEYKNIETLTVNGSFASLPFCTQMIADIFNKPVYINNNSNSVGLGGYLLSATEMGIFKDLETAAASIVLPEMFTPVTERHEVYQKYFKVFKSLSWKLADEFEAIADLQQELTE